MSRFTVVLALMLTWAAPFPVAASVFSHTLTDLPDLPTTPAEKATRAIYPGPVQWIFGAPDTDDGTFVSFLRSLRSFFAAETPVSRPAVSGMTEPDRGAGPEAATHRAWDAPLPVTVTAAGDVGRMDVFEIFLGVNLQHFLSRLFSAVLKVNEDILTDRREREREGWREVFFGGAAGSTSSYRNPSGSAPGGWHRRSLLGGGTIATNGGGLYFPYEDGNGKFDDKNAFVEVREKVIEFISHPLLLIGLVLAALCALMRKVHREAAAD